MEQTTKTDKTNDQAKEVPEEIIKQIMQVRETGRTNMFDIMGVLVVADELGLLDLQKYLFFRSNRDAYINLILNGKRAKTQKPDLPQN